MNEFMRQAKNEVFVEGILLEKEVHEGISKDSTPFVRAEIKILVNQVIGETLIPVIVPVKFFANKFKKDSQDISKLYTGILAINEMQSVADTGDEKTADCVRVDGGSKNFRNGNMSENVYVPAGSDKEFSTVDINGTSVRKIDRTRVNPITKFSAEIVVYNIKEEVIDGEPTGAIIVTGALVRYQNRLDLIQFKVNRQAAINHITNHWERGKTVLAEGYLHFRNEASVSKKEETGFGEAIEIPTTRFIKELIITSGSAGELPEELCYPTKELNEAMQDRLARIERMKEPKEVKPNLGF